MIAICEFCNKEYKTFENWYNRVEHHTCSRECSSNLRKKLSTKVCEHCNKEYYRKSHLKDSKYCSNKCLTESQKKRTTLVCNTCKKEYEVNIAREESSKFCSMKCLRVHTGKLASERTGELNPNYKGFGDEKRTNKSKLRSWSSLVRKRDVCCQQCGNTNNLHAHHIKSYSDFPELRFDINNGVLLCFKCHALQHADDEKTLRLFNRVKIKEGE